MFFFSRSLQPVQQESSIRFSPWQWRLPVPALTEHSAPLGRMRLDPHPQKPNPSTSPVVDPITNQEKKIGVVVFGADATYPTFFEALHNSLVLRVHPFHNSLVLRVLLLLRHAFL